MPPLAGRRPAARRVAAALFQRGGDALALGVRLVTGRGSSVPATSEPAADPHAGARESARRAAAAEEAAARLDAARERLRATIVAPDDDEDLEPVPPDAEASSAPPDAEPPSFAPQDADAPAPDPRPGP